MASKYWIKLYHEILDDPKMGRLPDALFRRTIEFFLIAGDFNREGVLPPLEDMAWRLRADETRLCAQMEDLETLSILSRGTDGSWRVEHFKERQAASLSVERVRRHRNTARKWENAPAGSCNETVTDCYTDTDAEGEEEIEKDVEADGRGLREQAPDVPEPRRPPGTRAKGIGRAEQAADIPETLRPPGARAKGNKDLEADADGRGLREHTSNVPTPQRLPGARATGIVDLEPDADESGGEENSGGGIRENELVKLFVKRTELPLFIGGEDKWARALERMRQARVGEADLELAIDECRQKGLTIASLGSVVNPAIIAMSRRRAGKPEEDYRRYLKGEYGEVGR